MVTVSFLQNFDQFIHIAAVGSPAGADAKDRSSVRQLFPETQFKERFKALLLRVIHSDKELVCGTRERDLVSFFDKCSADAVRCVDRVPADLLVKERGVKIILGLAFVLGIIYNVYTFAGEEM